jgi:protein-disulfide isomerase
MEASFGWEIDMWRGRASAAQSRSDRNQDGQAAYAFRQADIHMSMLAHCRHVWADAYALLHGNSVDGE